MQSRPTPRSLRLELLATLAIVLMMAVVSLSLATELLGRRRHLAQEVERVHQHAKSLAMVLAPLLRQETIPGPNCETVLRSSVGMAGIESVELFRIGRGPAQTLLSVGLPPSAPPPENLDPRAELEGEPPLVIVHEPIAAMGHTSGAILVRLVARPTAWTRIGDWTTSLVMALGVGVVLLLLGGLLLEAKVLRPLRAVHAAMSQVRGGDLQVEIPREGPAEFVLLASDFNTMTASLRRLLEETAESRERLARAQHLASVGSIAAGVAHEIGNPLAAITGYVDLMLDPRATPPLSAEPQRMLERVRGQLLRIQTIVAQLLDYSRPRRSACAPTSLETVVSNTVALLRHAPIAQGVDFDLSGVANLQAYADPERLEQILQNLLINACRAAKRPARATLAATTERHETTDGTTPLGAAAAPSPLHPRVAVFTRESDEDHEIWLDVQDNGPGVAASVRPHIFEPFFTTEGQGEGTGLGLAVSWGLAEGMGGRLECLPEATRPPLRTGDRPGAVFRLTLPGLDHGRASPGDPSADPIEGPAVEGPAVERGRDPQKSE